MTIVMAGGNIDVWNSGVAHFPHSTTDHPRDALLHCEALTNSSSSSHRTPACKTAVITWNQLTMPSNTQGTLQLLTTLVSHDGTGKLLGQINGEMAAGGSVSLELIGTTTTTSVPGRTGQVVSPIRVSVFHPILLSYLKYI